MGVVYLRKIGQATSSTAAVQYVYPIKVFDSFQVQYNMPISPMPMPEQSDDEQVLVKIEGNSTTVALSWLIHEETTNQATAYGSYSVGDTKTIWQQLQFLQDEEKFMPNGINDAYDIIVDANNNQTTASLGRVIANDSDPARDMYLTGFIQSFTVTTSSGEPATLRAQIHFIVGANVTSYGADTPSKPRSFKLTNTSLSGSGKVKLDWSPPSVLGGSTLTGYQAEYRNVTAGEGNWTHATPITNSSTVTQTITGLVSGNTYEFRVKADSNNEYGDWSYIEDTTASTS